MARKTNGQLHVFTGTFASRDEACLHSEAQWEPEPDDSVSDEEYAAWEDRNPVWSLRDELGIGLDSDFIETISGWPRYVAGYLVNPADMDVVRAKAGDANFAVLIFPDALHDSNSILKSTSKLTYCGAFDFGWG
ncbi:hypothetical protein [Rhodopirellula sallentina]|uniref:Uncharacterized protein n=1 Tax=Rhodopirellula sallentina SM41 TaxID=1263870 RepID=M5UIR1_9BACT|nr:hypothetical protein [Rhodopirellula sallentina]EMI57711.1 hypothetical protein RSSM_00848 [Rhodopirellula sallentina SM41]